MQRRFVVALGLCLLAPLLSSCNGISAGQGAECAAPLPILVSRDDHFTQGTADQILAADLWFKKRCPASR